MCALCNCDPPKNLALRFKLNYCSHKETSLILGKYSLQQSRFWYSSCLFPLVFFFSCMCLWYFCPGLNAAQSSAVFIMSPGWCAYSYVWCRWAGFTIQAAPFFRQQTSCPLLLFFFSSPELPRGTAQQGQDLPDWQERAKTTMLALPNADHPLPAVIYTCNRRRLHGCLYSASIKGWLPLVVTSISVLPCFDT